MSTNFYIRKRGSEEEGLHICLRAGGYLMFQAVYPSRRFTDLAKKLSTVYYYVEDYKDILPEDVQAIASVDDWIYVLENLPENAEVYNDNEYPVTACELVNIIKTSQPEPLEEYCELNEKQNEKSAWSEDFIHRLYEDDFIDRKGWQFAYRMFC